MSGSVDAAGSAHDPLEVSIEIPALFRYCAVVVSSRAGGTSATPASALPTVTTTASALATTASEPTSEQDSASTNRRAMSE